MGREQLEHIVTTGMIAGKSSRGKKREMMLDGLTKRLKVDRGRSTESDEGYKSMEGHDCLHYRALHLIDWFCWCFFSSDKQAYTLVNHNEQGIILLL